MSTLYNPGNIQIDKDSTLSDLHGNPGVPQRRPDGALWEASIIRWLDIIKSQIQGSPGVGSLLLNSIQTRPPPGNIVVKIVPFLALDYEAWTDKLPANSSSNPSANVIVLITYTPPDARGQIYSIDPWHHPASVLVHELTHAYMAIHGLNSLTGSAQRRSGILAWQTATYPNYKEFSATLIQNMFLSEYRAMLADGYTFDTEDPFIASHPTATAITTPVGIRSNYSNDMDGFIATYRQPLNFLLTNLPHFTARLAALRSPSFNPFRHMANLRTTTPARRRSHGRTPGPTGM